MPDKVDLLAALTAMADESLKIRPKRGRPKTKTKTKPLKGKQSKTLVKPPKVYPLSPRIGKTNSPRWSCEALVTLVFQVTCRCCDRTYEAPNPHRFILRYHPTYGKHYEAYYSDTQQFTGLLPRKVEYSESLIPECHHCLEETLIHPVQHDLPLTMEQAEGFKSGKPPSLLPSSFNNPQQKSLITQESNRKH